MILENTKLIMSMKTLITRVCDECGKTETARMAVVLKSRRNRGTDIDVCRQCACSAKYKPKGSWKAGESSHLWKGGRRQEEGRIRIYAGLGGRYVYEHRLIMEEKIGRKLEPNEIVHHIDMDSLNNSKDNLHLFANSSEHGICHYHLQEIMLSLLGTHVWFDREKIEYTLFPISHKDILPVDLSFMKGKSIRIFTRRNKEGSKSCSYFSELKDDKKWKYYKRYVHIEIMKRALNRPLWRNECVHHINGNSLDNSVENLIVVTTSRHGWLHRCNLQLIAGSLYKQGVLNFNNGTYSLVETK